MSPAGFDSVTGSDRTVVVDSGADALALAPGEFGVSVGASVAWAVVLGDDLELGLAVTLTLALCTVVDAVDVGATVVPVLQATSPVAASRAPSQRLPMGWTVIALLPLSGRFAGFPDSTNGRNS
jgi:hypothetical protein